MDCSGTRISRIETGRISVRPGDVRELLEIYGVTGGEADAPGATGPGGPAQRLVAHVRPGLPGWFEAYIGLEAEAVRLRDFQSMVIPGLLQTEDYARAVLRAAPNAGRAEDIEPAGRSCDASARPSSARPARLTCGWCSARACCGSRSERPGSCDPSFATWWTSPGIPTSRFRSCPSPPQRTCIRSARSPSWSSRTQPIRQWYTSNTSPAACSWRMNEVRRYTVVSTTCAPKPSAPAPRPTHRRCGMALPRR